MNDIKTNLLSWSSFIVSDYISASLILPVHNLDLSSWSKNGLYLLSLLHYHHPSLVPDLHLYTSLTAFERATCLIQENYHIPPPLIQDGDKITHYLIQLASCFNVPDKDSQMERHRDMERFKSLINANTNDKEEEETLNSSTTFTSTYTLQQLKITKTTVTKYSDGTEIPSELEEFESRASVLTEKINGLQHRLILIVPTRSHSYSPSSVASDSLMDFFLTDDNSSTTLRTGDNSSHHSLASHEEALQLIQQQQQLVRVLHPLQAAEEDYSAYDRNFKALQSEFQALTDGDLHLLVHAYLTEELAPVWRDHPKVIWRKEQILQLHNSLASEFERSEWTLSNFRRGFAFARMCSSIRHELDLVQNKMVKSITTHHDIEELEMRMVKTTGMVDMLKTNFGDLLLLATRNENQQLVLANHSEEDTIQAPSHQQQTDAAYLAKFELIESKNELVRTWVEEVRVWFAEAERIRQWIEIRSDQLNNTNLPDALVMVEVPATLEQVKAFNTTHALLEKEIETFDKEDMARLRSHVKTLTGSGRADKDLSPADTTTIEITLTTLMTLDKLIHLLKKKSYNLQVLTQRVLWEDEYVKTMAWLNETNDETDTFLNTSARWRASEAEDELEEAMSSNMKRERLMAKEKQKEMIVQQLLKLERKMAEFDQGQFTTTIELFQDLDNTSTVELPNHLESRQDACEEFFSDLMKRMTFARQVVEQRLNVMDFLYQIEMVMDDTRELQVDLADAETKAHPGDNDREMTARVQNMHERIVQLVTATAGRIRYPEPGLDMDKAPNAAANEEISQVITSKRNLLIELSEDLDQRLNAFRNVLLLHRRAKEHLDDAVRLCDWADERVKTIRRAKINVQDAASGSFTVEDLQRLERDRDNMLNKLKNGKENEVIDLLTHIQQLLETTERFNISSIDKDGLIEVSQQLEERFDRLQQILEEHGLDLEALRKKMEDGNTYFENARSLRSFINETRHSMPSLKQTCGFITGQSEEQDYHRFTMLNELLGKITTNYRTQQGQFSQLCARYNVMEPSKIENIDEIRTIQTNLQNDWAQLANEIQDMEHFSEMVGQWYDRQRRLSVVENDLLLGLNEKITQLAKNGWEESDLVAIQNKIDKATEALEEIGRAITTADNKEDPLQTANYSCARDRHTALLNKLRSASNNLIALKSNANNAMAFSAFLSETEEVSNQLQQQKDSVDRRMADVGSSGFASQSMVTIDDLCKKTQASTIRSEKDNQSFAKRLGELIQKSKELQSAGYDASSVGEPIDCIKQKLVQLTTAVGLEKKQAIFVRKMHIHAKAANDLQTWIDHCTNAITQLSTDVCAYDEQDLRNELDSLEQKMIEMTPTIQAFETIASRIFSANKDGSPLNLNEITLDRNEIEEAVHTRESGILAAWAALKKQLTEARSLLDNSIRRVEIARKFKTILTQVGDMKDRVSAVRICRSTQLDDGLENRDLNTILNCPLTSMPNEHRLASAKAELTILDRDIEAQLEPSVQDLDLMLSAIKNEEDMFSGQRAEITIAVRDLMDLMLSKRRAIAEAEKMEGFLIVMEELEVLLLALAEVVSRASPENARVVDGSYLRTDLQALLIDLDTRYRYYEPKINDLQDEAKEVAENLMDDHRVVECLGQLTEKWVKLQAEAASKKANLMSRIGPLTDTFDSLDINEGTLHERGRRAAEVLAKRAITPVRKESPIPKSIPSTPRYMTGYSRTGNNRNNTTTPVPFALSATAARATARRTTIGGNMSPTARRVAARQTAAQSQRQRISTKTPEAYVADPKNDLDVALGDIVNDSPYNILVKMVPGEVGKYWFGDVNPKLAYCRILRSRMVMVRVGGGWVELSQFLTDHALLEGNNFVSGRNSRASLKLNTNSGVRDGFLNTSGGRNSPQLNRGGTKGVISIRGSGGAGAGDGSNGANKNKSPTSPVMKESVSTPCHRGMSPISFGHGIKTGNKFLVTVDGDGNRVEVKMTKAKSKDAKFITPRRMNM